MANAGNTATTLHHDPALLERLFSGTRVAPLWIAARMYVGWVWLSVGWTLLQSPDEAVSVSGGVSEPGAGLPGSLAIWGTSDWGVTVAAACLTVAALAVMLGLVTGVAAFGGAVTSVSLMATDAATVGPVVIALAILLVLAWKTAGWIGLDRWVLPMLGAPWPGGFARFKGEGMARQNDPSIN